MANRLALIIGISAYPNSPLANPVNDANDMASILTNFDFDTIVRTDCDFASFDEALDEFESKLNAYEAGLFFFAGHGLQIDGMNYLVMTDTNNASKRSVQRTSATLDSVMSIMNSSPASISIVILDACRNNPWQRGWERDVDNRGLAPVFAPKGTIIGYATSPGETASDGEGRNGTYTGALLERIKEKDRPIEIIFKTVRNDVAAATNGDQTTWEHTSLSGEFYFDVSVATAAGGYSPKACSDKDFEALPNSLADTTIRALKSHNWYTQNPAIDALRAQLVEPMTRDELFVIGRNILQAAEGNAGSAMNFITSAPVKMRNWQPLKREALYDGILFEIFFRSDGTLRDEIKGRLFDEVFANRSSMMESFNFITNCLSQAGRKMFVPPNQNRPLEASVSVETLGNEDTMTGLWIGANDVMNIDDSLNPWHPVQTHESLSPAQLKAELSQLLAVPLSQLDIGFQPNPSEATISCPLGITFQD